jgi:hypothetical protein
LPTIGLWTNVYKTTVDPLCSLSSHYLHRIGADAVRQRSLVTMPSGRGRLAKRISFPACLSARTSLWERRSSSSRKQLASVLQAIRCPGQSRTIKTIGAAGDFDRKVPPFRCRPGRSRLNVKEWETGSRPPARAGSGERWDGAHSFQRGILRALFFCVWMDGLLQSLCCTEVQFSALAHKG